MQIGCHRISRWFFNFLVGVPEFCLWDLQLAPVDDMVIILHPRISKIHSFWGSPDPPTIFWVSGMPPYGLYLSYDLKLTPPDFPLVACTRSPSESPSVNRPVSCVQATGGKSGECQNYVSRSPVKTPTKDFLKKLIKLVLEIVVHFLSTPTSK